MANPGNSIAQLVAYWSGDPTNVPMSELNIPQGTIVIDTSASPATRQKTSTTDNSTFITLGTGAGGTYTGAILSSSPTQGVGYATGAGGTVTQATNKTTGVTLNKVSGQITMNGAALAAAAEAPFTLTNSAIAATDVIVVNVASGGTSGAYGLSITAVAAGSCEITVTNLSAGSLSEAIVLNFAVLKSVAS